MTRPPEENYRVPVQHDDEITLQDIIRVVVRALRVWPWMIACAFLGVVIGLIINATQLDQYASEVVISIEEKNAAVPAMGESFMDFGLGKSGAVGLRETVLKSYKHNMNVSRRLDAKVVYTTERGLRRWSTLAHPAFVVEVDEEHTQWIGMHASVTLGPEYAEIHWEAQGAPRSYEYSSGEYGTSSVQIEKQDRLRVPYGQWFTDGKNYRLKIQRNWDVAVPKGAHGFRLRTYQELAEWGMSHVQVTMDDKNEANILRLKAEGPDLGGLIAYLNATVEELQAFELDQKGETATNTLAFIDTQIGQIATRLKGSSEVLEEFRAAHLIVDIGAESQQIIERYVELEQEFAALELEQTYYRYIQKFLGEQSNYAALSLPTMTSFNDPLVLSLITKLVEQSGQLNRYNYALESSNPAVTELKKQLAYTKQSLLNATTNALASSEILAKDLSARIQAARQRIEKLPKVEQRYADIQREYELHAGQYEMLLQKRAEAGILRASQLPDTRVLDPALDRGQAPIGPKRSILILAACMLGGMIPAGLALGVDALSTKVHTRQDLEQISNLPIAATVVNSTHVSNLVVLEKPRAIVSEMFRSLRSSLRFFVKDALPGKGQVIAVTSSVSGEGKTFIATNLASVLSIGGKRAVIVGMDLRKPKVHDDFAMGNRKGLSTLLSGESKLDEVLQNTEYKGLDLLPSGVVPPNPSELILHDRFRQLIEELKSRYDYVVLDTPPVGIISDLFQVVDMLDGIVYVVRSGYTQKSALEFMNEQYRAGRVSNIAMVLNAVEKRKGYGYQYGYGYGYMEE